MLLPGKCMNLLPSAKSLRGFLWGIDTQVDHDPERA